MEIEILALVTILILGFGGMMKIGTHASNR
jgi:hypothetical protein